MEKDVSQWSVDEKREPNRKAPAIDLIQSLIFGKAEQGREFRV